MADGAHSRPIREPLIRVRSSRRWTPVDVPELFAFRDLLRILGVRDIKLRYRQTALGAFWVLLQPIVSALILTFVFRNIARLPSEGVPYLLFAYTGIATWGVVTSTMTRSAGALVGNTVLVSKIYFPRLILPLSALVASAVDWAVAFAILGVLLVLYGHAIGLSVLIAPAWVLAVAALALGAGLIVGATSVRYRDLMQATTLLLQLLMYASPVAYSPTVVPERYRDIYLLNPLATLLQGLRHSILGTSAPSGGRTVYSCVFALVTLCLGLGAFSRLERTFSDVI